MINEEEKCDRVIAYIRKSSEDNEQGEAYKQLNSIEYQKQFIRDAVQKYKLKPVIKVFKDDKTGYEAFVRDGEDGFMAMLDFLKTHKGEIDGIICTEISRLARNFGDGGMILWYLQNGTIKRIYTPSKVFTNSSSDQLMVAIEFAMSKKSSDDTGIRTKLAMKSKAQTMKHPARPAIIGYRTIGLAGRKEWSIDADVGPKMVMVFEDFAKGKKTLKEIADYAYEIGIRSTTKKSINKKLGKNTWFNRLRDRKYTGLFVHDGEEIVGNYIPLISKELFYRVQTVLGIRKHPKGVLMDYAYSGIVKCALCGGNLSGNHQKGITYYRCDKRMDPCKGERYVYAPEGRLEATLMNAFKSFEINEEAWNIARDYIIELSRPEKAEIAKQLRAIESEIRNKEDLKLEIGRKYSRDEMSKSEHDNLISDSNMQIQSIKVQAQRLKDALVELEKLMDSFVDSLKSITSRLEISLPENKRELIDIFCENLRWNGEKLLWDWKKPYYIFINQPISSNVLPRVDSNHGPFA